MKLVICKVDLSFPENQTQNVEHGQRLEDGEYIQRWVVELSHALKFMNELQEKHDYIPDARLAHFFIALDLMLNGLETMGLGRL